MVNLLQNIFLWLFFPPALLFAKDIQPWYKRLFLVLISPATYIIIGIPIVYIALMNSEDTLGMSFDVSHKYRNETEISRVTESYIPECDTLGATFHDCGMDFAIEERFRIKDGLSEAEAARLKKEVERSSCWLETDSTFEYNDHEKIKNGTSRQDNDIFRVTINKYDSTMVVEYGST